MTVNKTPNYSLNKPDKGTRDWDVYLNQNTDIVDGELKRLKDKDASQDLRIDNIVSQAGTDNTEIVDARLGADGVSRANLGTLVREMHSQLIDTNQQSTTIGHGLNVINASQNSPLDIRIEGRTLVNVSQNVLDPAKYYVLPDKKSKVKFADGTTYAGVAKFAGRAEKPILIRIANYDGKIAGSTLENPHLLKYYNGSVVAGLPFPTDTLETSQSNYDLVKTQNNSSYTISNTNNGKSAYHHFPFNLVKEIERNVGKIPANDTAGKVAWLKNNIARLTCNWWGYGISVGGNKANFKIWNANTSIWEVTLSHTSGSVAKLTITDNSTVNLRIDSNGFVHFLAYADPSDGVTASTINTDYVELEIELNQNAQLWNPRFPLYEVDGTTEYPNILTTWDENEVMRRYPMIESVQHVQNPYVIAEGENLLPPFTEWSTHANATITSPYVVSFNATGSYQEIYFDVPFIIGQTYTYSIGSKTGNGEIKIRALDASLNTLAQSYSQTSSSVSLTVPSNTNKLRVYVGTGSNTSGTFTFSQPMLTLGSNAKPFVPRNPSTLFAEAKLGSINGVSDRLYEQDGKYFVRKAIEKDVVLDGSQSWSFVQDYSGFKRVSVPLTNYLSNDFNSAVLLKFDGKLLKRSLSTIDSADQFDLPASSNLVWLTISDADSGFADTYTPTSDELKAYFNGWKVKTVDANNKPTAWTSLFDGSDAPTQTLDYVKANTAPNFTPYKLSYVLATPQVAEAKVEGAISVNGLTQVEVGSGVVIREKANVYVGSSTCAINDEGYPSSKLKNRTNRIISVYKNDRLDNIWTLSSNGVAYGTQKATIPKDQFDPTAEYTVTYLLLDRQSFTTNVLNVTATYANNIRSALDDTIKRVEDNTTNISIQARLLYDILKRLKAGGL